jgi:hypothetical protein
MAKKALSEKPTVFISHIHGEEHTANAVEAVLRKALLGAIEIFNSSNRRSISPGDPWRDRIVDTLQKSTCVLVLASPNSVSSPWVNFEAGGAWVSGTRVIPCCTGGMKPSSLPTPLSHLQGLSLDSVDGISSLVRQLAEISGLDFPSDFDFSYAAKSITDTWGSPASTLNNDILITWIQRAERRPTKHVNTEASGYFRVSQLDATDPQETKQFPRAGLRPGDSIRCRLEIEGEPNKTRYECFAHGEVADQLEEFPEGALLSGSLFCLGQMKVFTTDMVMDFDEDRGVEYPVAWLIKSVKRA